MTPRPVPVAALIGGLIRRPDLWGAALRFVPPAWWRRRPPSPVPPREYLRFRMETMYGTGGRLEPEELIRYLEWCRRVRPPARYRLLVRLRPSDPHAAGRPRADR